MKIVIEVCVSLGPIQFPIDRSAAATGLARVILSNEKHPASGILPRLMDQAFSKSVVCPVVHHASGAASDAPLFGALGHPGCLDLW